MPKKKSALFMTVGLGGKTQERIDSLAHGMLDTILEGNFDYVVLFGSEKSKSTIKSLKRQYHEKFNEEFDYYEFVQDDNINDFNSYYETIRSKVLELQNEYAIKINYTPGTKTMSISAAIASLVFRKKLRLIDGHRGDEPTVQPGTERHVDFGLYVVYDEVLIRRIKQAFNYNQYHLGKLLIDELTGENENKNNYHTLFDIYSNWDNINFEKAQSYFKDGFNSKFPELSKQLGLNKKALHFINPIEKKEGTVIRDKNYEYYILASLINNAERRFDEKKYDDAIARLYRSLEYIGQIRLKEYGIDNTENVEVSKLEELNTSQKFLDDLKEKVNDEETFKSGLDQNFQILNALGDDLGKYFDQNQKKIRGLLRSRNYSILAHGLESKTPKEYLDLKEIVMVFACKLHNDMENFIFETKFPKFKIKNF